MPDANELQSRLRRIADWIKQSGGDNNSQLFDEPLIAQLIEHLTACGIGFGDFLRSCGIEENWLDAIRAGSIRRLEAERMAAGLARLDGLGLADRTFAH
jgi:hypothetical protein